MTVALNFQRERQRELHRIAKKDQLIARISAGVAGVVAVVTVGVYGGNFFLQSRAAAAEDQQQVVERSIAQLNEVEMEYLILADKLDILTRLVTEKIEKQQVLEYFSLLFAAENAQLTEVSFQEAGLMRFDVQVNSVFAFETLLMRLETAEVRQRYPSLTVTDLARGSTGEYTTAITVVLSSEEEE